MASIYRRERSPFWWIEFVDPAGIKRQKSLKLRADSASETRMARETRREMARQEVQRSKRDVGEEWAAWVPRFLEQRYGGPEGNVLSGSGAKDVPASRLRYEAAWRNLEAFLRAKEIHVPRQLTRQRVRDFIAWRAKGERSLGIHAGVKNTALLEIKFLGAVMQEAIESGFCSHNPCVKLGIGRDQVKLKPRIQLDEHRLITRMVKRKPEWMRVSYKIAYEQGCRFSETCLPLADVDLERNVVGLRTKGKKEAVAEVPLSPRLRPLMRRLLREGRRTTFEMPKSPAKQWHMFLRKIGLGHLCFHCTRVTFITRCYEQGIDRETVMRLCLHASETVHLIYPRLPARSALLQEAMRRAATR